MILTNTKEKDEKEYKEAKKECRELKEKVGVQLWMQPKPYPNEYSLKNKKFLGLVLVQ